MFVSEKKVVHLHPLIAYKALKTGADLALTACRGGR